MRRGRRPYTFVFNPTDLLVSPVAFAHACAVAFHTRARNIMFVLLLYCWIKLGPGQGLGAPLAVQCLRALSQLLRAALAACFSAAYNVFSGAPIGAPDNIFRAQLLVLRTVLSSSSSVAEKL
jgi:hypothetical protein